MSQSKKSEILRHKKNNDVIDKSKKLLMKLKSHKSVKSGKKTKLNSVIITFTSLILLLLAKVSLYGHSHRRVFSTQLIAFWPQHIFVING